MTNFLTLDNNHLLIRRDSILAVARHDSRIELVTNGGPLHIQYGSARSALAEYEMICRAISTPEEG